MHFGYTKHDVAMSSMTSIEIKKKILLLNELNGHIPSLSLNKYLEMYSEAIIYEHKTEVLSALHETKEYEGDTSEQRMNRLKRRVNAI